MIKKKEMIDMVKEKAGDGSDLFQSQLAEAKRHCLISLLDFADELKKQVKDDTEKSRIERLKKRIHNDIGQFHQTASNLLELRKTGGKIIPFGRTDATNNRNKNNTTGKGNNGDDKKKTPSGSDSKRESSG